jgi:hypothetical protein
MLISWPRVRWTDFLWLLLFPIYLVIGTARHEGSHALTGAVRGASIVEFRRRRGGVYKKTYDRR